MSGSEEKRSAAFEGQVSLNEVIDYLKSLQTALKKGTVYVQNGGEIVTLQPGDNVTLEVEARAKKEKQSIKFSLRWEKEEEEEEEVPASSIFSISDKEPEPVAVAQEEDDEE
jgi:amphi-Trp domain-containing protein